MTPPSSLAMLCLWVAMHLILLLATALYLAILVRQIRNDLHNASTTLIEIKRLQMEHLAVARQAVSAADGSRKLVKQGLGESKEATGVPGELSEDTRGEDEAAGEERIGSADGARLLLSLPGSWRLSVERPLSASWMTRRIVVVLGYCGAARERLRGILMRAMGTDSCPRENRAE